MVATARRMSHLSTHFFASLSAKIAALQAEGKQVIRLDEGSPDLPPAAHIIEALTRSAILSDRHAYQPHRGPDGLRQAWAEMYLREYQVDLDPSSEIIPLLGSKEGIFHLSLAYLEPGDISLVPDPGYVSYTRGALFAGGEPYRVVMLPEANYLPDLSAIPPDVLRRAKLMWLNYPNNPTAAVATQDFFARAVDFARQHNLLLCHDAAYSKIAFDGEKPPSILEIPGAKEVAVEFNTLSKSHNMAGWRSGALLGNAGAVRNLFTLKTNADSSHFLPIFEASIAALTGEQSWLVERNEIYRQRRDVIVTTLKELGLPVQTPRASLYVWSPIPSGWDCEEFVNAALEKAGVSMTPGTVFGPRGEGYIRLAITAPIDQVRLGMQRLKEWLQ